MQNQDNPLIQKTGPSAFQGVFHEKMESFPGLAKTVSSFNDLYDGLVLCQVLKQM